MRKALALLLGLASLALIAGAVVTALRVREKEDVFPKRAIIVEKTESPYRLRLGYMDKRGLPHQAEASVSKDDWDQYHAGGMVEVYVSSSDPDRAWLQTEGEASWTVTILLGILAGVLGLGAIATSLSGDRRHTAP